MFKWFTFRRDSNSSSDDSGDDQQSNSHQRRSVSPFTRASSFISSKLNKNAIRQQTPPRPFPVTRQSSKASEDDDREMESIFNNQPAARTPIIEPSTPYRGPTPFRAGTPIARAATPAIQRILNESMSIEGGRATPFSNQSGRVQCQAKTVKGVQCRNAAVPGNSRCRVHNY